MDTQRTIAEIFSVPKALIGMIHVPALPGTPRGLLSVDAVCDHCVKEAIALARSGFHALMIENMHDRPYLRRQVGEEVIAAMTAVGREVRNATELPLGIQVLAGANRAALAVALGAGAAFIRVEGFVFSHVADEGPMHSDAGDLLRMRKRLGADTIRLFADVKKKHSSHAITADIDLVETARAAEFFLADGLIVTGSETGHAAVPDEVERVQRATQVPTLVGSGITAENLLDYRCADAFIVGSSLKRDGLWSNPLDPDRMGALTDAFQALA